MFDATTIFTTSGKTLMDVYKKVAGIDPLDIGGDADINLDIELAIAEIEVYLDRPIVVADQIEEHVFKMGGFPLRGFPVLSIVSVKIGGKSQDTTDYFVTQDGHLWLNGKRPHWSFSDHLVIEYVAGFDPIPTVLARAISLTAAVIAAEVGSSGFIKKEMITGVGSIDYASPTDAESGAAGSIPYQCLRGLESYKRWLA